MGDKIHRTEKCQGFSGNLVVGLCAIIAAAIAPVVTNLLNRSPSGTKTASTATSYSVKDAEGVGAESE